ncbi:MAG: nitrogen fixation protein NifK [Clostridiales bacterium]|jgi:nitrogenase molybdenum-iron protein beta chain|nr:nitrogen fixation protein NifK [Clostridiales bacterium]
MKKCTERPRVLCSLNGAVDVIGNLHKGIPILHAGPGCSMQAAVMTNLYYLGGYHGMPSSNTYEREVVFGGADRLRETIRGSLDVMDGELYAVLTGCTMGIIGDDVKAVLKEFEDSPYPLISVDVAGFKGDTNYGYQAAMMEVVRKLAKKTEPNPRLVNLYGQVPSQDMTLRGDLEELERVFAKLGLELNTFFIREDGIAQLKNSGNAALNVNISPWMCKNLDAYYERAFGIPTLRYPGMPVGPTAVGEFMGALSERLGLDRAAAERAISDERRYAYAYFDSLMGNFERHRYILVGESNAALGIARFLTNDCGHIPLAVIFTDDAPQSAQKEAEAHIRALECDNRIADVYFENDVYLIEQLAQKYSGRATMLLGSTYEKNIAKALDAFFVTVSAPCLDKEILNKSHVGIRGCISLMEDMYNHY